MPTAIESDIKQYLLWMKVHNYARTTIDWPSRSPIHCAATRAMMSTWPPAGKPTSSFIGCAG